MAINGLAGEHDHFRGAKVSVNSEKSVKIFDANINMPTRDDALAVALGIFRNVVGVTETKVDPMPGSKWWRLRVYARHFIHPDSPIGQIVQDQIRTYIHKYEKGCGMSGKRRKYTVVDRFTNSVFGMRQDDSGEWVRFKDYMEVLDELATLKRDIREIEQESSGMDEVIDETKRGLSTLSEFSKKINKASERIQNA